MEYSLTDLEEASRALLSTLNKCEKVLESEKLKPAQRTLTQRRVSALEIALSLIERERQAAASRVQGLDLFMMCTKLNGKALSVLPQGFSIRHCRRDELALWKTFPFDTPEQAKAHQPYMDQYFNQVYGKQEALFFNRCLFICDINDTPVGTCFAWEAYGKVCTLHWFKVLKSHEGQGLGRALLSHVMKGIPENQYPVFLHTQPQSLQAIKLYSDFGFILLTDSVVGLRQNGLNDSLPYLQAHLPASVYKSLKYEQAPQAFLDAVNQSAINEF